MAAAVVENDTVQEELENVDGHSLGTFLGNSEEMYGPQMPTASSDEFCSEGVRAECIRHPPIWCVSFCNIK